MCINVYINIPKCIDGSKEGSSGEVSLHDAMKREIKVLCIKSIPEP